MRTGWPSSGGEVKQRVRLGRVLNADPSLSDDETCRLEASGPSYIACNSPGVWLFTGHESATAATSVVDAGFSVVFQGNLPRCDVRRITRTTSGLACARLSAALGSSGNDLVAELSPG